MLLPLVELHIHSPNFSALAAVLVAADGIAAVTVVAFGNVLVVVVGFMLAY